MVILSQSWQRLLQVWLPNDTVNVEDEKGILHLPHEIEAGPVEYKRTLVHASDERIVHLTSQMKWRLREGTRNFPVFCHFTPVFGPGHLHVNNPTECYRD